MDRPFPNVLLARHDYAGYITTLNAAYLVGRPVQYQASEQYDVAKITDSCFNQSISDLDSELAEDAEKESSAKIPTNFGTQNFGNEDNETDDTSLEDLG